LVAIFLLLLIPLGLRYLAVRHMNLLHRRLAHGEEDLRQLQARFSVVREDLIDTRRRVRQYQVRKNFIGNDIHRERERLVEARSQARTDRMAA
jgi:predicted  nucleic acid-binding Zn-ribbon protein